LQLVAAKYYRRPARASREVIDPLA
jgi:hypothetical protein